MDGVCYRLRGAGISVSEMELTRFPRISIAGPLCLFTFAARLGNCAGREKLCCKLSQVPSIGQAAHTGEAACKISARENLPPCFLSLYSMGIELNASLGKK